MVTPRPAEPLTIAELLTKLREFLAARGSPSPRLDAELLLARVLNKPRIYLFTHFDQPTTAAERAALRSLTVRRAAHEPMAYILGEQEFFGHAFAVDRRVLIPRPETEHLVEAAIGHLRALTRAEGAEQGAEQGVPSDPATEPKWLLDLGCGSGAVAISVALADPTWRVLAVDISADALLVARANAKAHGVADRVFFVEGDLSELASAHVSWLQPSALPDGPALPAAFSVIASNPPYIGERERASLPKSVVMFEPQQALFAGDDGTVLLKLLAASAPRWLAADGLLAMELAPAQAADIAALCRVWGQADIVADLAGRERLCLAWRGERPG